MKNKPAPQAGVHGAISLDGDPENVKRYYGQWADSYDADLREEYRAAQFIAELADDSVRRGLGKLPAGISERAGLTVADMGCGTGLVGQAFSQLGYATIDGMDLSAQMVAQAAKLGCYRALYGDVNLNQPLRHEWNDAYDITLCCGVFTLGHVEPQALYQLAAITRVGGLIVASTRTAYYDASDYRAVSDQVQSEGLLRLVHSVMDAPYTGDSDAHYWVYEVAGSRPDDK